MVASKKTLEIVVGDHYFLWICFIKIINNYCLRIKHLGLAAYHAAAGRANQDCLIIWSLHDSITECAAYHAAAGRVTRACMIIWSLQAGLLAENLDLTPFEQKCLKNIKFFQLLGIISYFYHFFVAILTQFEAFLPN